MRDAEPRDFNAEMKDWKEKEVSKIVVHYEDGSTAEYNDMNEARQAVGDQEKPETIH